MKVYRKFERNSKNMQEKMKEIIRRYFIEYYCSQFQSELNTLEITNSIRN